MSDDVLITPASRKIEFKDNSGNIDGKIELDSNGNLNITSPGGDIGLGDATADVFIGDGTNNVDIVFEQNGEIRGLAGKTLTLGQSDSNVDVAAQNFTVKADTDASAEIGRAHVGSMGYSDYAGFSHVDQNGTTTYALLQQSNGYTYLNAASSGNIHFRINNTDVMVADATGLHLEKALIENAYNLTGTALDPSNGTLQYKTLSGNTTFTESFVDGESITLMIDDGSSYTVTWPTMTWASGSAPTLATTGYTTVVLWHRGGLYGAVVS